jgi:hypothetical protein
MNEDKDLPPKESGEVCFICLGTGIILDPGEDGGKPCQAGCAAPQPQEMRDE